MDSQGIQAAGFQEIIIHKSRIQSTEHWLQHTSLPETHLSGTINQLIQVSNSRHSTHFLDGSNLASRWILGRWIACKAVLPTVFVQTWPRACHRTDRFFMEFLICYLLHSSFDSLVLRESDNKLMQVEDTLSTN